MIKKLIAAIVLVAIAAGGLSSCGKKLPSKIYTSDGELMTELGYTGWGYVALEDEGQASYVDIAIRETVAILADKFDITEEEAEKKLISNGYTVNTVFDCDVYKSLISGETDMVDNIAVAVTDLNGAVLATYARCDKYNEDRNLANAKFHPCSAFKPLSVYAPSLERGDISWSTMTLDTPVKKVQSETGGMRDWPSNATGKYTEKNLSIEQAIKESVNTVAVKTLMDYGVDNAITYLSEKYGIDTEYESQISQAYGEDEVLSNIGLGFLKAGVNVVDMAGYYQVFASKGIYTKPYTVKSIIDANGETVYESAPEGKQILSEDTAYVMNKLLQSVVEKGGTGSAAASNGIALCGKTGTGDNEAENWTDNWFVGVTPTYTCAIWHSSYSISNVAAAMFAEVTKGIAIDGARDFEPCVNVIKVAYCSESGKRLGDKCRSMEVGYFKTSDVPEKCDEH